nr:RecName: Full=Maticotoxin A; AltName: Full=Three-finger toxin; Short=3FTx [Calliophis bivirgatus]
LICYNTPFKDISKTCAEGENLCYYGKKDAVWNLYPIRGCAD